MPRTPRKISKSGIYHAIIRTKENTVFEKQKNCLKFLKVLKAVKELNDIQIYAYCIMPAHVHILLKSDYNLSAVFKRLAAMYVKWYNREYDKSGALFHDRFVSEPIETDDDFLKVIGFIHCNPVKDGLCANPADFKFSSYNEYFKKRSSVIDTSALLKLTDIFGYETLHNNKTKFIEVPEHTVIRKTDEQANELIREFVSAKQVEKFEYMSLINQHRCIMMLKENGVSIRQIHRLTGVPVSTARKSHRF